MEAEAAAVECVYIDNTPGSRMSCVFHENIVIDRCCFFFSLVVVIVHHHFGRKQSCTQEEKSINDDTANCSKPKNSLLNISRHNTMRIENQPYISLQLHIFSNWLLLIFIIDMHNHCVELQRQLSCRANAANNDYAKR